MEFRILGPVEAVDGDRTIPLGGAKPRALLAALLLRAGEIVSVERLIDELWGEAPPATAVASLQMHVSQLRKALGREAIVRRGAGYVLDLDGNELDLLRFEQLVAEARELPAGEAAVRLREALALWRGEPEADRSRLEELRLAALEARIGADLKRGLGAELVPELQSLVEAEPLREQPRTQLMHALYRAGRQAEALEEYARARATLVEELGIEPGPELQRLQRLVLAQDPSLAAPARGRSPLPVPATALLGRDAELDAAGALFAAGARLVTLTGPGGIGKTRLALELARRLDPAAVYVPLAAIEDPALVPSAVASALGLTVGGQTAEEAVALSLRGADALLVLDNFEQLLAGAPYVASLLAEAPQLRVLVTSRAPLRVAGEREHAVPPLEAGDDAVALFVARAAAVAPGFAPDADERATIADICARLDGLPLAIELAAARTKLLAPAALQARLDSRLRLLTSGARDAPERHQTMRAAIDWSYRLLQPDEQVLFARLATFAGGASIEAIEDVCGAGLEVLDALGALVDNSLVRRRGSRFAMLETLHEYAAEQLRALDEEDVLRERHLAFYVAFAAEAETQIEGARQDEWFPQVEAELPNVRAALAFALARDDAPAALALAGGLRRFWQIHGYLDEGARWLEAALGAGEAPATVVERAWTGLGILRGDRGDLDGARDAFTRALETARTLADDDRIAAALNNLGILAMFAGSFDEAQRLYDEVLAIRRRDSSLHGLNVVLENLGSVALLRGEVDAAVEALVEARECALELGELRAVSSTSRWLGRAEVERGNIEPARALLLESLAVAMQIGHRQGAACAIDFAATYAAATGRPLEGARLLGGADSLFDATGAARPPDETMLVAATEREIQGAVGAGACAEARAAGRALDAEAAVALAHAVLDQPGD